MTLIFSKPLFMHLISLNIVTDGGVVFMIPLLLLIACLAGLFIWGLMQPLKLNKAKSLIKEISLLAMVWGFLGSSIGLIGAFDAIEGSGNTTTPIMASGLKIALITTLFGLAAMVMGRLFVVLLTLKSNE